MIQPFLSLWQLWSGNERSDFCIKNKGKLCSARIIRLYAVLYILGGQLEHAFATFLDRVESSGIEWQQTRSEVKRVVRRPSI